MGVALVFSGLIVSIAADNWRQSFFGYYQRHTGFLVFSASVLVALSVATLFGAKGRDALINVLRVSAVISSLYVILQAISLDPFSWNAPGQNVPLFGTMGNINTSSGFLGISLPFVSSVMFHESRRVTQAGVVATSLVSIAIGLNQSFQGVLAGLFALLVIWLREFDGSASGVAKRLGLSAWLVSNLFAVQDRSGIVIALGTTLLVSVMLLRSPLNVQGKRQIPRNVLAGGAVAIMVILASFGFGTIRQEVEDGFRERRYFYESAMASFAGSPFIGQGFDTFVFHFGEGRPEEHAVNNEANRTSSPHSIPLGIFHSGGLLLGVPYLAFISLGVFSSIRLLISRKGNRGVAISSAAGFLASFVQNLVSVEHVAIFTTSGAVLGLSVGAWIEHRRPKGSEESGSQRSRRKQKKMQMWVVIGAVLASIVFSPWLTRPFRADVSALEGFKAVNSGDATSGMERFIRSFELVPWDVQQLSRLASLQDAAGLTAESAASYNLLMDISDYSPLFGVQAAFAVANSGDFSRASEIGDNVLANDPFAPDLRAEIVDLNEQLAIKMQEFGNDSAANSFVSKAKSIASQGSVN